MARTVGLPPDWGPKTREATRCNDSAVTASILSAISDTGILRLWTSSCAKEAPSAHRFTRLAEQSARAHLMTKVLNLDRAAFESHREAALELIFGSAELFWGYGAIQQKCELVYEVRKDRRSCRWRERGKQAE
jgi:hypothetical protein